MAEDESAGQFLLFTPKHLQLIDQLITVRIETSNSRVENAGEDTSTPVSGTLPILLVTSAAGSLTLTLQLHGEVGN